MESKVKEWLSRELDGKLIRDYEYKYCVVTPAGLEKAKAEHGFYWDGSPNQEEIRTVGAPTGLQLVEYTEPERDGMRLEMQDNCFNMDTVKISPDYLCYNIQYEGDDETAWLGEDNFFVLRSADTLQLFRCGWSIPANYELVDTFPLEKEPA